MLIQKRLLSLLLRNKKTSNDSNVKEAEASTSSGNIFKTVGNDCKANDTVDVKINDDLADVVNGFLEKEFLMRNILKS